MRLARNVVLASLVVLAMACQKKEAPAPAPAAPAAAPAPAAPSNEILIGHVASMTGEQATFGESTDNAVKLAIEEANAAGGVKGKQLKLKTYDDQGKPDETCCSLYMKTNIFISFFSNRFRIS